MWATRATIFFGSIPGPMKVAAWRSASDLTRTICAFSPNRRWCSLRKPSLGSRASAMRAGQSRAAGVVPQPQVAACGKSRHSRQYAGVGGVPEVDIPGISLPDQDYGDL